MVWSPFLDTIMGVFVQADSPLATSDDIDFYHDLKGMTCLYSYGDSIDEIRTELIKAKVEVRTSVANSTVLAQEVANGGAIVFAPIEIVNSLAKRNPITKSVTCSNFPLSTMAYLIRRTNATAAELNLAAVLERVRDGYRAFRDSRDEEGAPS